MSRVISLCEEKDLSYAALMEAVEEFVDSLVDDASPELYEATAKRLLGENLSHDEIMLDVPFCTQRDLIVLERAPNVGDMKFNISTDTHIKVMLKRLQLGRKGLLALYKTFSELSKQNPNKTDGYLMAKAAHIHGLPDKETQVILTKMIAKHNMREHYLQMADEVLSEETPVNTSGSTVADHEATDGDRRLAGKSPKKRKKLEDFADK